MKRYMIFAFDGFYPAGGIDDLQMFVESLEKVSDFVDNFDKVDYKYYQVFDVVTGEILETNDHY